MTLPLFLVVDDVPTSRQAVMRAVVQALPAARVLTATSVAELRKALEHARVTTIIADAYLPDGNAQDVLAAARVRPATARRNPLGRGARIPG